METNPPHLSELNRYASYLINHIDLANLTSPRVLERVERIADISAYGLLLHCYPQRCPAFVSIKVFGLAGLPRPLPGEACKTFMNILHETDTWKYAGAYMHHFNQYAHDDLFTSAAFTISASGQVVTLDTCSRALSFSGKNPYVILTLFGTGELFRQQALTDHSPAALELSKAMSLTPCEYDVYKYRNDPLTHEELGIILKRSPETVRSQKRAVIQKFAAYRPPG
ncbi:MAG: helix-turn-helix transcriptional regulator [Bacteroidia bacterium]